MAYLEEAMGEDIKYGSVFCCSYKIVNNLIVKSSHAVTKIFNRVENSMDYA